jgi:hypothetical protein
VNVLCPYGKSDTTAEHIFGNSSVALTSDILERPVWLVHLGLDANFSELPAYPRVWMGHFHWIDIQVVKGVNDESVFDKISLKFPTKFVEYETGNSSMLAPPRPSATKMEAQGSLFAKRTLSFEDYVLLSVDVHAKKRKKRSLPMPPTTASSGSTGRPVANPYFEFFIGNAEKVVSLVKMMNSHGKLCGGEIYFRRVELTTRRLSLVFKCTCSLGKQCRKCENGVFRWLSTNEIRISPTRSFHIPDVLYALAVSMTPNTMAHAD